jgi:hypothetical protein
MHHYESEQAAPGTIYFAPMQDAINEFLAAPVWAQVAMVFFAVMAAVMFVEPAIRRRKFRARYDAIARGIGAEPPGGDFPFKVSTTVDGRAFDVTHDHRSSRNAGMYRGPYGFLLSTSTRLTGSRWATNQVDVTKVGKILSGLVGSMAASGDPEFDARFMVMEDGTPVRGGWLNADSRLALASFLDNVPPRGSLRIRDGALHYIMADPWEGLDAPVVQALLRRQAVLAAALEHAAGPMQ